MDELRTVLLLTLLCGVALAAALLLVRRTLSRARHRGRIRRGLQLEQRAAALLEREGFSILQSQAHLDWNIVCDDETLPVLLKADYLVRRDGQDWVVDVKSGQGANPRSIATRRQLLEYALAYRTAGALLVDMEREVVHRFRFGTLAGEGRGVRPAGIVLLAVLLIIAAALTVGALR